MRVRRISSWDMRETLRSIVAPAGAGLRLSQATGTALDACISNVAQGVSLDHLEAQRKGVWSTYEQTRRAGRGTAWPRRRCQPWRYMWPHKTDGDLKSLKDRDIERNIETFPIVALSARLEGKCVRSLYSTGVRCSSNAVADTRPLLISDYWPRVYMAPSN